MLMYLNNEKKFVFDVLPIALFFSRCDKYKKRMPKFPLPRAKFMIMLKDIVSYVKWVPLENIGQNYCSREVKEKIRNCISYSFHSGNMRYIFSQILNILWINFEKCQGILSFNRRIKD